MGGEIRFLLNGAPRIVKDAAPTTTVLDFLRLGERASGTKEGCAEGDCGACTVVLGEAADEGIRWQAINSCIAFLPQIDGKILLTVEGLAEAEALHPVQKALVDHDASQCGFCTPGFAMALFAFQHGGESPAPDAVHEALAGNLCRCTGYRPIIAAAEAVAGATDRFDAAAPALLEALAALTQGGSISLEHQGERSFAPSSLDELLALRAEHPDAHLLAGGTDLALFVTKEYRTLPTVILLTRVPELRHLAVDGDAVTIGAAVTYTNALPVIERYWPSFARLIRRIGSRQIRNLGTIGGNIANASPIGDTPPALIALGATLRLRSRRGSREMPLEDFFIGYRKTALAADEIVESLRIPLPQAAQRFRTDKIAKRWDQDIAAVCAAFNLTIRAGRIEAARIAYGGMAATPRRAARTEAALIGRAWDLPTVEIATAALAEDFQPIGDWRAGAAYRRDVAANLLRRFWLETARPDLPLEVMAL
ncbi:MAG TPA: xanthine dehydrogenase small subunit [Stellaceae bacterium]|nr:xanthine dehydrogenase small subunit [Stellaceae bacterium]